MPSRLSSAVPQLIHPFDFVCRFSATACCQTPSGATVTKTEAAPTGGCKPAIWARVIGQSVDNRYQAFADPQATGQILGFQAGFDLRRRPPRSALRECR
jgi:hypothetical protein